MGARLGRWSAFTVCVIGVAYMAALASGFAIYGLAAPIVDPLLAVMEVLTLVSALFLLVMMAALHDYASATRKVYGALALALMTLVVGMTSAVHFVELTALRQLGTGVIVWPSVPYAVELLAWDLLLGLSLLFAACVFEGNGPAGRVRWGLSISGALCLAGVLGYPPLRVVRFAKDAMAEGVTQHRLEGVPVRLTTPARTVVDCSSSTGTRSVSTSPWKYSGPVEGDATASSTISGDSRSCNV